VIILAWSGRWRRILLAPRRGTAGPRSIVAGGISSPRRFLLGSRPSSRLADLATSTVIILALAVSEPLLLNGLPGDTYVNIIVLALTGLAFGRLRSFRLRGRTSGPVVCFRPRVRSRRGRW
jgi:hypothetical protein